MCSHTQPCRAVPPRRCPSTEAAPLDTLGDRADTGPAPGPTPPQPGQERRRATAGPQSLPSPVQSPVPHAPEEVNETSTGKKIPCETFETYQGLPCVKHHQRCDRVVSHPPCCGCTLLSKPGEKRRHLLLTYPLVISD